MILQEGERVPDPIPPDGYQIDRDPYFYVTGVGQVLRNIHRSSECWGFSCVFHNPSDHHMRSYPTSYHVGGPLDIPPHMERICPHGVGHPDPDDVAFFGGAIAVHGCDGCCSVIPETQEELDYTKYPPGHAPGTPM